MLYSENKMDYQHQVMTGIVVIGLKIHNVIVDGIDKILRGHSSHLVYT